MRSALSLTRRKRTVPIFLAADDKYVKYMMVTMKSIIDLSAMPVLIDITSFMCYTQIFLRRIRRW